MKRGFDLRNFLLQSVPLACGLLGMVSLSCLAQDVVYRCGLQYTNAPLDPTRCERLPTQAITVVPGTRPAGVGSVPGRPVAGDAVPSGGERTKTEPLSSGTPLQSERDAQARTIVAQELDKARQQLAQLQQEYNQGEPVKWAAEARNHQKYLDRVAALKAAMERTERDIDSLQRELARRPVLAKTTSP